MRVCGIANAVMALVASLIFCSVAVGQQSQLPADSLAMAASRALVWNQGKYSVVELHSPVSIDLDRTHLTADGAVVWMSPALGGLLDEQRVEISLVGNARLEQGSTVRMDRALLVTAVVSGEIRLTGDRAAQVDEESLLYRQALAVREGRNPGDIHNADEAQGEPGGLRRRWVEAPMLPASQPTTEPAVLVTPKRNVQVQWGESQNEYDDHGNIAAVLSGGVTLRFTDAAGNLLEFQADRGVLFTDLKTTKGVGGENMKRFFADHVQAAYFEGDVRVYELPIDGARNELRMEAQRVYYELDSDRAVMTDVAFHTVDMKRQIPAFFRAQTLRQLSSTEFVLNNMQLTTSSFATPAYSLGAAKAYVRADATNNPEEGDAVTFQAKDVVFEGLGIPFFYLPTASGTMTSKGEPLREVAIEDSSDFGFGVRTEWGLFESLGIVAPKDLDASFKVDYLSARGPGGGIDARYGGGFVDDDTKDPWNFLGDLHAYFINDHGEDVLGGIRPNETPPHEFRGRANLEHQDFFPDGWEAQIRLGYVSDANFQTQWFPDEFYNGLPLDESIYLKHQQETEVFTLLAQWQPNGVVTTADGLQEQREVEHIPEVGYYRVGDSFLDDNLTFFSANTAAGLEFDRSGATLAQQGFIPGYEPGLPSFGYTGDPNDPTYRGDFREEVDWPLNAGTFKIVPYAMGRYTVYSQGVAGPYSNSPIRGIPATVQTSSDQNRLMAGAGVRISTEFWRVDDSAESDLFDIHRIRHVIEPEINLYTSAQTIDQNRLFIYDEDTDSVNDIQALQVALRQRWQTKRGGPGRWRSVDLFTLNVYGNFYANQPAPQFRDPVDFRGLFFGSMPEASVARNSINGDALWRISDTMAVLGDVSQNLDRGKIATASIGLAAQRGDRVSYFIGVRYLPDLDSTVASAELNYQLTQTYSIGVSDSINLGQNNGVFYQAELTRKFERFSLGVRVYYDETNNDEGFSFQFVPYGLARGISSDHLNQLGQQPQ